MGNDLEEFDCDFLYIHFPHSSQKTIFPRLRSPTPKPSVRMLASLILTGKRELDAGKGYASGSPLRTPNK